MKRLSPAFLLIIIIILLCLSGSSPAAPDGGSSYSDKQTRSSLGDTRSFSDVNEEIPGIVIDCESGDPIALATVAVKETGEVTITGSDGGFLVHFPMGAEELHLFVSHISYFPSQDFVVSYRTESEISVCLKEKVYKVETVEVGAERVEEQKPFSRSDDGIQWGCYSDRPCVFAQRTPVRCIEFRFRR